MNFESRIAALCLYGLIHNQGEKDRKKCMESIRNCYGKKVSETVAGYFRKEHL